MSDKLEIKQIIPAKSGWCIVTHNEKKPRSPYVAPVVAWVWAREMWIDGEEVGYDDVFFGINPADMESQVLSRPSEEHGFMGYIRDGEDPLERWPNGRRRTVEEELAEAKTRGLL